MTTYYPQGVDNKPVTLTKEGVSRYLETTARPWMRGFLNNAGNVRQAHHQEREMGWDNKDVAEAYFHASKEVARLEAVIVVIESGAETLPLELYP